MKNERWVRTNFSYNNRLLLGLPKVVQICQNQMLILGSGRQALYDFRKGKINIGNFYNIPPSQNSELIGHNWKDKIYVKIDDENLVWSKIKEFKLKSLKTN